jgi:2'-5' RNA ligase
MQRSMQSIILPVPEADPLVDRFRREGDWSRRLGVPAHITLAGPFPLSLEMPKERLAAIARRAAGVPFTLGELGRLGDATCLLLAESEPLGALRSELVGALGMNRRTEETWPLHLTISRKGGAREAALRAALEPSLPLECRIAGVALAVLHRERLDLIPIDGSG